MGGDPPSVEGPCGLPPTGGPVDSGLVTQTPTERDMSISTHLDDDGNGGTRRYQGLYYALTEHGCTTHYDLSYHGIVSGGGAEARDAALAEMMGAARSIYPRDKISTSDIGYGGRDGDGGIGVRDRLGYGRAEGGLITRVTREDQAETWQRST